MNDSTALYNRLLTGNNSLRKAVCAQLDQMVQAQTNAIGDLETFTGSWLGRRREALESAGDVIRRAAGTANAADLWTLYVEWTNGEMNRLAEDVSAITKRVSKLGEDFQQDPAGEAAQDFKRGIRRAAQETKSQAA